MLNKKLISKIGKEFCQTTDNRVAVLLDHYALSEIIDDFIEYLDKYLEENNINYEETSNED